MKLVLNLVLGCGAALTASAAPRTFCNPLSLPEIGRGMYEKKEGVVFREVSDPTLLRENGTWYLFPSCKQGWKSADDGATWTAFDPGVTNVDYAPSVVKHRGEFLFVTRRADLWTASVPEGPYRRLGKIAVPRNDGASNPDDPMLFSDDDGRLYFYWGCTETQGIFGCELDANNPQKPLTPAKELTKFDPANRPWERHVDNPKIAWIEGAWMIKIDGKYHLTYSAGGTEHDSYAMGEYVGKGPLGPFEPSKAEPFFISPDGLNRGTGHGSVVRDERGDYWVAYCITVRNRHRYERRVGIDRLDVGYWGNLQPACSSDVPQWLPKYGKGPAYRQVALKTDPAATNCIDGSLQTGYEPKAKSFTLDFAFDRFETVRAVRLVWGGGEAARYRLAVGDKVVVDTTDEKEDRMCDYREIEPVCFKTARLTVTGPFRGDAPPVLLEFSLFAEKPAEETPAAVGRRIIDQFLSTDPEGYLAKGFTGYKYGDGNYVCYSVASLWVNALAFARETGDAELEKKLLDRFWPFLPGGAKEKKVPLAKHVDFAVFGSVPLEVARLTGDARAKAMGLKYADDQWRPPEKGDLELCPKFIRSQILSDETQEAYLKNGYSGQTRLWIDDMYMINLLQTQAYRVTGDRRYIDRAAKEMCLYLDRLQLENGLFNHAADVPFAWGRGNGWMAAGMPMILQYLDATSPHYAKILAGYRKMMATLLGYQRENGLWGQLVDDPKSWDETSGSAMFAYGFALGVRLGLLERAVYRPRAEKAFAALANRMDRYGNLYDVCIGTGAKNDRQYYYDRSRTTGDPHGHAALLWLVNELVLPEVAKPVDWEKASEVQPGVRVLERRETVRGKAGLRPAGQLPGYAHAAASGGTLSGPALSLPGGGGRTPPGLELGG